MARARTFIVVACAAILLAIPASALSFTATSGNLAASAEFIDNGDGTLTIILTNTSTYDVLVPADVLTGLFFSSNDTTLTSVSALLTAGSTVLYDPDGQPAGGVVGGEWAYGAGLVGAPGGATQGISSSGLNLFGGATFPGADLAPPAAVDGLQYGITSAGDNAGTGNGGITGSGGLIQNSVTFVLGGWSGSLSSITNVSFQYGTDLTEPNIRPDDPGQPLVPEPATVTLVGMGLAAMAAMKLRSKLAS